MIQSMTGFFSEETIWELESGKKIGLSVESKSLNNRFFELSPKLPSFLVSLENQIIRIFKQKLNRGKVFLNIKLSSDEIVTEKVSINSAAVAGYIEAFKKIESITNQTINLGQVDWLSLPRVINIDSDILSTNDVTNFLKICEKWASHLSIDRVREGDGIKIDLIKAVDKITKLSQTIYATNSEIVNKVKSALEAHKHQIEQVKEDDHLLKIEQRKLAELEIMLDKSNINEETNRLEMHLGSIKSMLSSTDLEIGKKLEFTLQELLRETNTISSKSSDYLINSSCVEIKYELEKMREQSQNIV